MPTITVRLDDGETGGTGTKRLTFRPRQPFIDGDTIVTPDRFSKVVTRNTATTVTLRPGPWQVSGINNQTPIPFDVGTDDANLKNLISLSISGTIPTTATLTEIVNAWLAEHGGGGSASWSSITGKPTVIAAGPDAPTARAAIGAMAKTEADQNYAPLVSAVGSYTYDANGNVTGTPDGTTYTWESDGAGGYRVHTETVAGVTRTYTYNSDGTLGSVA